MKKIAGTILICTIVFFCTHAFAQDLNRFGIGLNVAYQDFEPGNFGDVDFNFKRTALGNVTLTYHLNRSYSIELSGGVNKSDMMLEYDDKSGVLGELEQESIALTARYRFIINRTQSYVHIGGGAGYYFNEFTNIDRDGIDDFFALNQTAESDNSIGVHFLVGAEIYVTPHVAVCLELKCIFNKADFEVTYPDEAVEINEVALNAAIYSLGLKYYF